MKQRRELRQALGDGKCLMEPNCASICSRVSVGVAAQACVQLTRMRTDNINSVPNAREIEFAAG